MAWTRIHKTHNAATGGTSVVTGYTTETVQLLNWAAGANNGISAYTSHINIPVKGDITVLIKFSTALGSDMKIHIEHSIDGINWYIEAQQNTTVVTNQGAGSALEKLAVIDVSAIDEENGYWAMFDIDTHGFTGYTRIGFFDNNINLSSTTATVTLVPHF